MRHLRPPSIKSVLRPKRTHKSRVVSAEKKRLAHWQWLGKKGYIFARNRYYLLHIADLPCAWCQSRKKRIADHKLPRALGGTHDLENLQVLCSDCHKRKTRWDMRYIRAFRKTGRKTYVEPPKGVIDGRSSQRSCESGVSASEGVDRDEIEDSASTTVA